MQARSKILFELEFRCYEELQLWGSFDLNNSLTFWKKAIFEKSNFAYFVRKHRENELFLYAR